MFEGLRKKIGETFKEEMVEEHIVVDVNENNPEQMASTTASDLAAVRNRVATARAAEETKRVPKEVLEAMASITNDVTAMESEVKGPIVSETLPSKTTLPKDFQTYTPPASPRQPIHVSPAEAQPSLITDQIKETAGDRGHLATMAHMREEAAKETGIKPSSLSIDLGSLDAPLPLPTKETIGAKSVESIKEEPVIKKTIRENKPVNEGGTSEIEATLAAIRGEDVHIKTSANEIITDVPVNKVLSETPTEKKDALIEATVSAESNDAEKPVTEEAEKKTIPTRIESREPIEEVIEENPQASVEGDNPTVITTPTPEKKTTKESSLLLPTELELERILSGAQNEIDAERKEEIKEALALYIASDMNLRELLDGVVTEDKRPLIEMVKGAGHASADKQELAKVINRAGEMKQAA
ncbi:hypothetical protein CL644_00210 [bacterium]|nr:hypothetical protein [Parcubacteria group bacterium]MBF05122.1 hypothetical protein [bacterium]|tara:strand:+ start:11686 stop:12924 length:1239 start_codon:yes stop_codon:yes gene_type:complete